MLYQLMEGGGRKKKKNTSPLTSYSIHMILAHAAMCESDDRGEEGETEGRGDYHEPHYVNKVQGHVPVKPQCRAK